MIDFIKALTENQTYINRLLYYAENNLQKHRPQNNNYNSYSTGSGRFRLEFRKIHKNGIHIGFRNVEICFSPHYLFNNNLHNGNDFSPVQCIKVITETFIKIGIRVTEFRDFKIVNLEYGLNLNTGLQIENLISGILYIKKTPFIVPHHAIEYFKISKSTKYKEIKAYAKGLQFVEFPQYRIDRNIFRFEVKTKQSKNIKMLGIFTVTDLTNLHTYNYLFQSLINEWQNVLILNINLKDTVNNCEFWSGIISHENRNKFRDERQKYYKNIDLKDNYNHIVKCKMIDKITSLTKDANSTQKTFIETTNEVLGKNYSLMINLENAFLLDT
ncbi:hypothetical protein [Kaistella polysaccharea]|uniref:hypothetical protein n=1 Tax=Kaistella polysaccharea TaxID=2878534 RepID=UPI001CF155DA|nr:hypothetical protein [Kaistella polysaccharea]